MSPGKSVGLMATVTATALPSDLDSHPPLEPSTSMGSSSQQDSSKSSDSESSDEEIVESSEDEWQPPVKKARTMSE